MKPLTKGHCAHPGPFAGIVAEAQFTVKIQLEIRRIDRVLNDYKELVLLFSTPN